MVISPCESIVIENSKLQMLKVAPKINSSSKHGFSEVLDHIAQLASKFGQIKQSTLELMLPNT